MPSGDTNNQSSTATTWIAFSDRTASTSVTMRTFPFDTTTKTIGSEIDNFIFHSTSYSAGEFISFNSDYGTTAGIAPLYNESPYDGTSYTRLLDADLGGVTGATILAPPDPDNDPPGQWYGGTIRLNDTQGAYWSSNGASQGVYIFDYDGSSTAPGNIAGTVSGVNHGGSGWYAFYTELAYSRGGLSSPGSGSTYANIGTDHQICWIGGQGTWNDSNTTIHVGIFDWDGADDGDTTRHGEDDGGDANSAQVTFTIPTHTDSEYGPKLLATTWGNVVIHGDSADSSNNCVFPMTWVGTTPTIGSSISWPDNIGVDVTDCFWTGLDGINNLPIHKFTCGQSRTGSTDIYRTFAFRHVSTGTTATANVNGTTSSSTALVVDGNSGTIVAGMVVTGTGVGGQTDDEPIIVTTVTDQNTLVLGTSQSLSDDVALTFTQMDTHIDTIRIDFTDSTGKHEVELLCKSAVEFAGVAVPISKADPVFMENNTDLLLWVRGTNLSDATESRLIYLENAFFDR
jgi:hypothetical protein